MIDQDGLSHATPGTPEICEKESEAFFIPAIEFLKIQVDSFEDGRDFREGDIGEWDAASGGAEF